MTTALIFRSVTWPADVDVETTESALAASAGDRHALERFIRATQHDVWRFTAHLAGTAAADDLTQETYLRVLRSLPDFEGRSSARVWLLSIARRVVVDQFRKAGRRPRQVLGIDLTQLSDDRQLGGRSAPSGFEEAVELDLLLASLAPERREVLVLTQLLGLSYEEAALVCGCAIGTVRSRVARARDELIRAMDESHDAGTA
ncbi:sigma-70 family RNA polymerase sigma factor [Actinoalloteichus sp. GBA129-24]|uniref:sigma-70 family RNA polymerase sigma factor n=1 Tax=Actinoalloteichus sp. GBA129-24 TaxID=1612551 RepID=UPI00095072FF|nr:sigma-70 family RNA polymerase sigma factor [Actinoalloteichus sp. GBA129-24]APU20631.1 RNA polymerase sigma factor, sigma-70 family [Actinoalloteichus sp. GBA129-24]